MKQSVVRIRTLEIGNKMPKICVPVVGHTETEILEGVKNAKAVKPDLIEFRADWYEEVKDTGKVAAVLQKIRDSIGELPLLFTFRSSREGGEAALSLEEYQHLNETVAASGLVDCIDVELFAGEVIVKALIRAAHENDVKVIVSNHDFDKTPEENELLSRLKKMEELGADIPKIAVMPQCSKDVLTLLSVTESWKHTGRQPAITMSMAGEGLISRLAGEVFGSAVTFGAAGKSSAPGQIEAEELRQILEVIHKNLVERDEKMAENIFLIGFMGAGKSTIAKVLKEKLNIPLCEMDEMIVKQQNKAISDIFAESGESYFRDLETQLVKDIARQNGTIVSCGGGAVLREENVSSMKENGKIVLLSATPETIYERVRYSKDRPILNGHMNVEYIRELMEKRRSRYESVADITVATDGKSAEMIADEIIEKLREA